MQLAVYGKNLELTDALRNFVQQKLDKLDRFFAGSELTAQVVLSVQREHQTVEVTIPVEGLLLRAQESDTSMYTACDRVLDKLERQLHKYKTRLIRKPRRDAAVSAVTEAQREESEDGVLREKRFPVKPMTVEEAILQMELLGHDFFVFRDAGTEAVRVVYRRRHGGYGLIAAE